MCCCSKGWTKRNLDTGNARKFTFTKTLTSFPLMREKWDYSKYFQSILKSSVNRCLLKAIICNLHLWMFCWILIYQSFKGSYAFLMSEKPVETSRCEKSWDRNEDPVFILASNTYTEKSVKLFQSCIFWSKYRRCLYFKVAVRGKQH